MIVREGEPIVADIDNTITYVCLVSDRNPHSRSLGAIVKVKDIVAIYVNDLKDQLEEWLECNLSGGVLEPVDLQEVPNCSVSDISEWYDETGHIKVTCIKR